MEKNIYNRQSHSSCASDRSTVKIKSNHHNMQKILNFRIQQNQIHLKQNCVRTEINTYCIRTDTLLTINNIIIISCYTSTKPNIHAIIPKAQTTKVLATLIITTTRYPVPSISFKWKHNTKQLFGP